MDPRPQTKVIKTETDPVEKQFCTSRARLWLQMTLYTRPISGKMRRT